MAPAPLVHRSPDPDGDWPKTHAPVVAELGLPPIAPGEAPGDRAWRLLVAQAASGVHTVADASFNDSCRQRQGVIEWTRHY